MGKELDPGIHLQHSPWHFSLNCDSNIQQLNAVQSFNPVVFSTYFNPYGCMFSVPFPGFQTTSFFQKTSISVPPLIPSYEPVDIAGSEKRFLVFDQSGDQPSLIFSSSGIRLPYINSVNQGLDLQDSNEANGSKGYEGEEMHEDTEEIDALLYSDSDDDNYDQEQASTGHSPFETVVQSSSEVASSVVPAKRRRVDADELDASLVDTASSAVLRQPIIPTAYESKNNDYDAESSSVREDCNPNARNKRLKIARIQQTVGVLRRIIPGGKGKDAATILDEAIRYLKYFKLKAKSLGAI